MHVIRDAVEALKFITAFLHAMHAYSFGPIPFLLVMQFSSIIAIGCQAKE